MRKRTVGVAALILAVGGCQFGDDIAANVQGSPVRLVSATETIEQAGPPLSTFTHAVLREGDLRLVVRTYFYTAGPLARPYVTVDDEGHGTLHVGVKPHFALLSMKCEFLRQFEVEIPAAQWRPLKSLQVYNHDTHESATGAMPLSDRAYFTQLLRESEQQVALRHVPAEHPGC